VRAQASVFRDILVSSRFARLALKRGSRAVALEVVEAVCQEHLNSCRMARVHAVRPVVGVLILLMWGA
jgi:hypothetical protein